MSAHNAPADGPVDHTLIAEDVAHGAGVLCAQTVTGDHGLRYEAGVWRCVHCNATLRLGVWYPAHNDGPDGAR